MTEATETLRGECRTRGLPLTAQRKVVFDVLRSRFDHPTADEMYDAVRRRLSGVSRATVYRILATFVEWGIAGKVFSGSRGSRFDGNVHPHDHLHCTRCDRVDDCAGQAARISRPRDAQRRGFLIRGYSVVFQGLCSECSRKER